MADSLSQVLQNSIDRPFVKEVFLLFYRVTESLKISFLAFLKIRVVNII